MSVKTTEMIAESISRELEATRASFHEVLDSMHEGDFHRQSLNPGWSNGEILVHILFGFIVLNVLLPMAKVWGKYPPDSSKPFAALLNALTKPFNWINELGARFQSKIFTYRRLGILFDRYYDRLTLKASRIKPEEWDQGMHYPTRWDPNFSDFMTLEKLFHYVAAHTRFHMGQISK